MAAKSLKRLPGFGEFEYDYLEDERRQRIAVERAKTLDPTDWAQTAEQQQLFDRLRASRNNKPILFLE